MKKKRSPILRTIPGRWRSARLFVLHPANCQRNPCAAFGLVLFCVSRTMKPFLRGGFVVWLLFLAPLAMLAPGRITAQDHSETARKIVARTAPQYRTLSRSMRIEGSVKADVLVAPNGTVKSVEIKGGHPLLVQTAQNALDRKSTRLNSSHRCISYA